MATIDPRAKWVKDYHKLEVVTIGSKQSKKISSVLIEEGDVEYRIGNLVIPITEKIIKVGCFRHLASKNKAKALVIDNSVVKESSRMKWVNAVVKVIDEKIR